MVGSGVRPPSEGVPDRSTQFLLHPSVAPQRARPVPERDARSAASWSTGRMYREDRRGNLPQARARPDARRFNYELPTIPAQIRCPATTARHAQGALRFENAGSGTMIPPEMNGVPLNPPQSYTALPHD